MGAAETNESIGDIAKDPLKGGADQAYKKLRSEVIGTDAYDTAAAHNRMYEATQDMVNQGVLPQVSAAWLKNEFSRIDTNGNGQIDRSELQMAEQQRTRFGAFDQQFASVVDEQLFDKLASYDQRTGENNISKGALNRFLRRDDRANQKAINQDDTKDVLAPLFEGPDPLINYLNKDGNRRVSKHEMKEFLKDYEKFQGQYPYTEQNAKLVQDLLKHDVPELHAGINAGFSAKKSAREMGLDSAHGRKHKDFSLTTEEYDEKRPYPRNQDQPQPVQEPVAPPGQDSGTTVHEPEKVICAEPPESYTVKKGDCVWNIAKGKLEQHHEDVKNREIKRYVRNISDLNRLNDNGRNENLIYPNEVLFIPPIYGPSEAAARANEATNGRSDAKPDSSVKPIECYPQDSASQQPQTYFGPEYYE